MRTHILPFLKNYFGGAFSHVNLVSTRYLVVHKRVISHERWVLIQNSNNIIYYAQYIFTNDSV